MYFTKVRIWIANFIKSLAKRRFRVLLPLIYLLILAFGLVLTGFYVFVPSLVTCSELFAEKFCIPTGIYLAFLVNIPGYFIAGNLLPFLENISWWISLIVIIIVSGIFYFLVGLLIDKFKVKVPTTKGISKYIIVLAFILLLVFFISLIKRQ